MWPLTLPSHVAGCFGLKASGDEQLDPVISDSSCCVVSIWAGISGFVGSPPLIPFCTVVDPTVFFFFLMLDMIACG